MDIKSTIESIKSFFLDFLGFFIPGFSILLFFSIFYKIELDLPFVKEQYVFVNLTISYAIGYCLYGLTDLLYSKFHSEWEKNLKDTESFQKVMNKGGESFNDLDLRKVRNICMSKTPHNDQKVYTFAFRGLLAEQLTTVCLISLLLVLLGFFDCLDVYDKVSDTLVRYAILVILSTLIMGAFFTARRYYKISMMLPFYEYLAKKENQ